MSNNVFSYGRKPYVKRQKNDAADAEAICEAVTRPTMRFVALKTEEQQAVLMLHRTRELLIRQKTMLINSLRGQLGELGIIAPQGRTGLADLVRLVSDEQVHLPALVRDAMLLLVSQLKETVSRITVMDQRIVHWHRSNDVSLRLESIPGVGPLTASVIAASVVDGKQFRGRQFAAWLGLVPREKDRPRYVLDGISRLDAMELAGLPLVSDEGELTGARFDQLWEKDRVCSTASGRQIKPGTDPYAYVISANIRRRHLTAEQKRELIAKLIKSTPEKSDRAIAKTAKVDHKTVGAVRGNLEARGEVPHVATRKDAKGRPPHMRAGASFRPLRFPWPRANLNVLIAPVKLGRASQSRAKSS